MFKLEISRFRELDFACNESINTLCTNLVFMGSDKKKLMFTSCIAHEGKSFVSMNVMRTLAKLGRKVLFIDSDLRRSQILTRYGLVAEEGDGKGLAHYLAGMAKLEDVVYETNIPGAYMIPVGHAVSNSLALLNTNLFGDMLNRLEDQFDYIILDAPPVGAIIDAAEIAKYCDGAVFVIKYNAVSRKELELAKSQIDRSGCAVLGAVINDVEFDSLSSKRYYNKAYYYRYETDYYKPRQKRKKANP